MTLVLVAQLLLVTCKPDNSLQCSRNRGLSVHEYDNAGLVQKEIENNEVIAKALILDVEVIVEKFLCAKPANNQFLIGTAHAMYKKRFDEFYDAGRIGITCDRDYSTLYPAGTELLPLFYAKGNEYFLMESPKDSTGQYQFQVHLYYRDRSGMDTNLVVFTRPLKLKI